MIRSKEATGKTVEEARAAACAALGVSEDDLNVSYEVLEMPQSTGFLGLKKIPAKVRVIVEEEDPAPAAPEKPAVKVVRAEKAQPAEPAEKAEKAQPAPAPQPAGWRNQLITPLLCHCLLNHRQIAVSARHSRLPSNTCLTCSMAQPRFMTRLIQTRHSLASPSPIARARRK